MITGAEEEEKAVIVKGDVEMVFSTKRLKTFKDSGADLGSDAHSQSQELEIPLVGASSSLP